MYHLAMLNPTKWIEPNVAIGLICLALFGSLPIVVHIMRRHIQWALDVIEEGSR